MYICHVCIGQTNANVQFTFSFSNLNNFH